LKANQRIKTLTTNDVAYQKIIGGIVALLLTIIVGVMVYWETQSSIDGFETQTETFTEDMDGTTFTRYDGTTGSNYTGVTVKLDNSPGTVSSVIAWNGTGSSVAQQTVTATTQYTLSHRQLSIVADQLTNFTQLNVTYSSNMDSSEDDISDMATTVFNLAPIIALVIIAGIILGVVLGFGSGKKGGL